MKTVFNVVALSLCLILVMGCGGKTEVPLENVFNEVKEIVKADLHKVLDEEAFAEADLPGYIVVDLKTEEGKNMLGQVNHDHLEKGYMIGAMMNINADMILVLEAKEGKKEDVVAALEAVLEGQIELWSTYLPDQYAKVQKAIIEEAGNYLLYVVYENPEAVRDAFVAALK